MDDLVKVIQFIIEKKKMKGTYDESNYNYESIIKKVKKLNCTFQSTKTAFRDSKDENRTNFFEFATAVLSSGSGITSGTGKVANEADGESSPSKRRPTIHTKSDLQAELPTNPKMIFNTPQRGKKGISETDLLFGYCEKEDLNEKLSQSEFNAITFDNPVPNLAIDFMLY